MQKQEKEVNKILETRIQNYSTRQLNTCKDT